MTSQKTKRRVPLLDLSVQNAPIREEILAAMARVLDSQQFILGEDMRLLEDEIAGYCGTSHAVGCASGSDALSLSLQALGVGPGDTVVTVPFTFFATAGSIARAGARPVFVDIDPATFNMDPARLGEALELHPETKAVVPVHLYGGCADMDPILELARSHGCVVIEDGAQSIGAEYKGRRALGIGDVGCLSFFPSKNLGGPGDAGMITTNDKKLAEKLASLRMHGENRRYHHRWIGTNSRMDTLQAAVLRVKLPHLDDWTAARRTNAECYAARLAGESLPVSLPRPADYQTRHVFNQFVVRCPRRDQLRERLEENGIGSQIYYPVPLHLQECFAYLGYREGDFPESEKAALEVVALPVAPGLAEDDIDYVCDAIREFYS